jgi:monoamine oxidase
MENNLSDIIIIGAGLTGLTLAYLLRNTNLSVQILEARERPGGRIHTAAAPSGVTIEMGATWMGRKHTSLSSLLKDLKIDIFEQALGERAIYESMSGSPAQLVVLPENSDPSFRIRGGTSKLIEALLESIPDSHISYNKVVQTIADTGDGVEVKSETAVFRGKIVVSTLPPYLLHKTVSINPPFPTDLSRLMDQTHTWMGESIKFGLVYKTPFWREAKTSGTLFSNVGPVTEMYDHTHFEDDRYALKGFLNTSFYSMPVEERRLRILNQLRTYYGDVVDTFLAYFEKVWAYETFTYSEYEKPVFPHQNNGNPLYRQAWINGKLLIAGSETAGEFPGYMEGAVQSAEWVQKYILNPKKD